MTIVVGWTPAPSGQAALDLGILLARSAGESLQVVTVVPAPWPVPSPARVDGEFAAWAAERGEVAVVAAREHLSQNAPDLPATCSWRHARSAAAGLDRAGADHQAIMTVLGSSSDGPHGRVVVGSTAGRLLHSSRIPVALASRGYRPGTATTVGRVTCAYRDDAGSVEVLQRTTAIAVAVGATLRVATFGVRGRTMYPPQVAIRTEDDVLAAWAEQAASAHARALAALDGAVEPHAVQTALAVGRDWAQALDDLPWERDDVLVVGSSPGSVLSRVFLGTTATKIVRHSPVPVVVVPSGG